MPEIYFRERGKFFANPTLAFDAKYHFTNDVKILSDKWRAVTM